MRRPVIVVLLVGLALHFLQEAVAPRRPTRPRPRGRALRTWTEMMVFTY